MALLHFRPKFSEQFHQVQCKILLSASCTSIATDIYWVQRNKILSIAFFLAIAENSIVKFPFWLFVLALNHQQACNSFFDVLKNVCCHL